MWTANEEVRGGGGGGRGAFKRMFSKIDSKPTLQIKQNLKHDLSFLNKYVNSRRRVPAKVLVQSIRLLKPGEKKKHAHTCASSRVRHKNRYRYRQRRKGGDNQLYVHIQLTTLASSCDAQNDAKEFPTGVIELIPLLSLLEWFGFVRLPRNLRGTEPPWSQNLRSKLLRLQS